MKQSHARLIVHLMPLILTGLLLTCGVGPLDADGEISSATSPQAGAVYVASEPMLPRDFVLPMLFSTRPTTRSTH